MRGPQEGDPERPGQPSIVCTIGGYQEGLLNRYTMHRVCSAFEHQRLSDRRFGTRDVTIRTVETEDSRKMLTCCDSSVLDVSGFIPQAESSTTTLDVGIACTGPSEAQARMREEIVRELRYILRSKAGERGGRVGDGHGSSALYKSSRGQQKAI